MPTYPVELRSVGILESDLHDTRYWRVGRVDQIWLRWGDRVVVVSVRSAYYGQGAEERAHLLRITYARIVRGRPLKVEVSYAMRAKKAQNTSAAYSLAGQGTKADTDFILHGIDCTPSFRSELAVYFAMAPIQRIARLTSS